MKEKKIKTSKNRASGTVHSGFFLHFLFVLFLLGWRCDRKKCKLPWQFYDKFSMRVCMFICMCVQIRQKQNSEFSIYSWKFNQLGKEDGKKKGRAMTNEKVNNIIHALNFKLWDSVQILFLFSFTLDFYAVPYSYVHTIYLKCDGIFHAIYMREIHKNTSLLTVTIVAVAVAPLPLIYGLFAVLIIKCSNWNRHIWSIIIYLYWQLSLSLFFVYKSATWGCKLLYVVVR